MASRKSMHNIMLDSAIHSPPFTSSPLRRKSFAAQRSICDSSLSENDDEAERLVLRKKLSDVSASVTSTNSNDRRRSLGLGFLVNMPVSQMAQRISQCIKLGTENKINPKNAFSLEMIDFMTYLIKKQDANMSNLQVASTSLDVSTKIYGFRVDGVHMEILKMIGGLEKKGKDDNQVNALEQDCHKEITNNEIINMKKKKTKKKQQIFNNAETLKTNVEIEKPSLITMESDLQTTNMLYQVLLPNHAHSQFYLHPYNDVLVDQVTFTDVHNKGVTCSIPKITNFSHMEICPPLLHFNFQNWNADDEPEEVQSEKDSESRFQFDLDTSVPYENQHIFNMDCSGNEEHIEENIDKCAILPNSVENIVDFRSVLSNLVPSRVSEYSYVQKTLNIHWAGPSHWKVTNFKKTLSNSKVIAKCQQAPIKKKKEIELYYDHETKKNLSTKFLLNRTVKINTKTVKVEWKEDILTLPVDKHYDIAQTNKLYLHTMIFKQPTSRREINTCLFDNVESYNHGDNHDTSIAYSNMNNYEHQQNKSFTIENRDAYSQVPFTGDNLVTVPKLVKKLSVTYCMRAKKIDMKQLKQSIWICLSSKKNNTRDIEKEEPMQQNISKMHDTEYFSKAYKKLPNFLTRTNIEALSFPISFVSLLHLANEKMLKITSTPELEDLIVEQD